MVGILSEQVSSPARGNRSAGGVDRGLRRLEADAGAFLVGHDGGDHPTLGDHLEFGGTHLGGRGRCRGGGAGWEGGNWGLWHCRLGSGGYRAGKRSDPSVRVGGAQSRLEVRDLFLESLVLGAQLLDLGCLTKPLTHVLPPEMDHREGFHSICPRRRGDEVDEGDDERPAAETKIPGENPPRPRR